MRCKSEGLRPIPARKGVGREAGVDQCEMAFVIDGNQIMVVLVDLDRGKLALVNNVFVAEGAQIEPVVQANGVRGTFTKDIELSLEFLLIEVFRVSDDGLGAVTVCRMENNEWL